MQLDVVIFGGGAAGLWLLDTLVERNYRVLLLEAHALGAGQTIASQGIIHGGLKYTLQGMLTPSAAGIREMPLVWRDCLAGRRTPDLQGTHIRSEFCYLWRTESVSSRLGMIGARFGLRVTPQTVDVADRPPVLASCPGTVSRLDEQVISPASFVSELAIRHRNRVLLVDGNDGAAVETSAAGRVDAIRLGNPSTGASLRLEPRTVVFTAGGGNDELRKQAGLSTGSMQRRPLHMVMLRGAGLPNLNGHCVDGAKTRVTITSDRDDNGRTVWQVGGQLAELGVDQDETTLLRSAAGELSACIPGIDLSDVEWAAYRVDRAEGRTANGSRPDTSIIHREGNVTTAWPTKLALAPHLAADVASQLPAPDESLDFDPTVFADWPRPQVAEGPWQTSRRWYTTDELRRQSNKAA